MNTKIQEVTIIDAAAADQNETVKLAATDNSPSLVEVSISDSKTDNLFPIQFTDAAAIRVQQLIEEEQNPDLKLRVYVTGGGCSGFQYGFTFDDNVGTGDTEIINKTVSMVVDPMSLQYLVGGVVDFISGLEGARFVVNNPNATTTCGCGSSFSI